MQPRWVAMLAVCAGCGRLGEDPRQDCGASALGDGSSSAAPLAFVQAAYMAATSGGTNVTFALPQRAGDAIVVFLSAALPAQYLKDSIGNTYGQAIGPVSGITAYYAAPIVGVPAGGNTVEVSFETTTDIELFVAEYSGVDPTSPIDTATGAMGNSATADSGPIVTTSAHDELVAMEATGGFTEGPGPGFANRVLAPDGSLLEDREVTAAGTYDATATLTAANGWTIVAVALRGR